MIFAIFITFARVFDWYILTLENESVLWKQNFFHGNGICFMEMVSVLWKQNLFHGGGGI